MRLLGPLLLVAALLASSLPAAAHEHMCVRGTTVTEDTEGPERCTAQDDLHVTIGWTSEPAVTGQKNGLDLGVEWPGNRTPVTNLTTLTAQYEFGGQTFPLELAPRFGMPGRYTADIIPTRPGTYTVRIGGTVHGRAVSFTVSPEEVTAAGDLTFPKEGAADTAALQQRIGALEGQVSALTAKVNALENRTTPSRDGVTPTPAPTPGLEAAFVLLGVAALAWAARRRA